MTWSMLYLSRTALAQRDFAEARQLLEESLTQALELVAFDAATQVGADIRLRT